MLAALKTVVRPFLLPGKCATAKLRRLWAYELNNREGGDTRSVFVFTFCVLNFLTLLRSPADNTNRNAKRARGHEALPGDPDFDESVREVTVGLCPLLEEPIAWTREQRGGKAYHPFSPSIDRICNDKGYVKGNEWIVCLKANSRPRENCSQFRKPPETALNVPSFLQKRLSLSSIVLNE